MNCCRIFNAGFEGLPLKRSGRGSQFPVSYRAMSEYPSA